MSLPNFIVPSNNSKMAHSGRSDLRGLPMIVNAQLRAHSHLGRGQWLVVTHCYHFIPPSRSHPGSKVATKFESFFLFLHGQWLYKVPDISSSSLSWSIAWYRSNHNSKVTTKFESSFLFLRDNGYIRFLTFPPTSLFRSIAWCRHQTTTYLFQQLFLWAWHLLE